MEKLSRVSIVGLGKLGAPMAAAIASKGIQVIGVDLDDNKVAAINRLAAPVYEPGLSELLQKSAGYVSATTDLYQAVLDSQATFIVVATPSQPDGHFSLEYVLKACQVIGEALKKKDAWHTVVVTSTVSPLSMDRHIRPTLESISGKTAGKDFGLAYNPEFIALGTVIRDFLNPDLILIGESDKTTGDLLQDLYERVLDKKPYYARMNFVNAELTKLAINTFVTTKISFANMIARICERLPEADADTVTTALGMDSRIGSKYLRGAISYGGPCFPRDNLALIALARQVGITADIAETTDSFNRWQNQWLAEFIYQHLTLGQKVGILGIAYKTGSDVITESPAIYVMEHLLQKGISIIAYDPAAHTNARSIFGENIIWADSAAECIAQAEVIVILTTWPEFKNLPSNAWSPDGVIRKVIDCWRFLPEIADHPKVDYIPLGKSVQAPVTQTSVETSA
ncbi:MAG: nucleotide sugar dehydrogenase [Bacteroidia bacterium]|nr:nucleotide sugar dehydrogenase [Bacteroidia bacterium]MCX7651651.1 nucleotide sugar dehydrogenase [Bacteroidia bacterium]MDW8415977.1 nucleotide sugar dehydrogenase [Bacteroidia bacterium]